VERLLPEIGLQTYRMFALAPLSRWKYERLVKEAILNEEVSV